MPWDRVDFLHPQHLDQLSSRSSWYHDRRCLDLVWHHCVSKQLGHTIRPASSSGKIYDFQTRNERDFNFVTCTPFFFDYVQVVTSKSFHFGPPHTVRYPKPQWLSSLPCLWIVTVETLWDWPLCPLLKGFQRMILLLWDIEVSFVEMRSFCTLSSIPSHPLAVTWQSHMSSATSIHCPHPITLGESLIGGT